MDQASSNISCKFNIRSQTLTFQQENYEKTAWDQLENTHSGITLKLSWNYRAWFAKNFISVSAAARGSIGKGDGVVPGQECNEGREAENHISAEEAASTQQL